MKTSDLIRHQYEFLYTSNNRLLDVMAGMTEEEYARDNGFSNYRSLRGILTHTLDAETTFMYRLIDGSTAPAITEADVPTVEALRERWSNLETTCRSYLASLDEEGVDATINFTRRDGSAGSVPAWHLLSIVYQHTLQHRSEAAEALTLIGRSPGSMDFSFYLASLAQK